MSNGAHIIWRKYFFSQLRRNFLSIQYENREWNKQKADHALEWGNDTTPDLWDSITQNIGDRSEPTLIDLKNSIHPLKIWKSDNKNRRNPCKINQEYWLHEEDRIGIWFYHSVLITKELLSDYKTRKESLSNYELAFYNYIHKSLDRLGKIDLSNFLEIHNWMQNEIHLMSTTTINMDWFFTANNKLLNESIKQTVNNNYMIIAQLDNKINSDFFCGFINEIEFNKINNSTSNNRSYGIIKINNNNHSYFMKLSKKYTSIKIDIDSNILLKDIINFENSKNINLQSKIDIDVFDETYKGKRRKEQKKLKNIYFGGKNPDIECGICGKTFNKSFVWMSHLKKRGECSDEEKSDINVVMPMCLFGCDKLYEEGYIYIDKGVIRHNKMLTNITKDMLEYVNTIVGKETKYWDGYIINGAITNGSNRQKYCRWHYEENSK